MIAHRLINIQGFFLSFFSSGASEKSVREWWVKLHVSECYFVLRLFLREELHLESRRRRCLDFI